MYSPNHQKNLLRKTKTISSFGRLYLLENARKNRVINDKNMRKIRNTRMIEKHDLDDSFVYDWNYPQQKVNFHDCF
jgi:hypothetical protein